MEQNLVKIKLKEKTDTFVSEIEGIEITTQADYSSAEEFAKSVKSLIKDVTDYWEPLRKSTYDAYSKVNASKKEMLDPLKEAEKLIKSKMSDYLTRKRIEDEKKAEEERARILDEAMKSRELAMSCDGIDAEMAILDAEMLESQAESISSDVKVKGATKTWKIKSVDSSLVPVEFEGVEIRPVDTDAVLRLIKQSKGKISIPGIEFEEEYKITVRS